MKKAISDKQSDILRLILLFLNEEFYEIPQNQLPEFLLEKILKKYQVDSFSKNILFIIYYLLFFMYFNYFSFTLYF